MLPLEISLTNTVMSEAAREQRDMVESGRRHNFNSISKHASRCIFLEERSNYNRSEAYKSILDYLKTTGFNQVSNVKNLYLLTILENGFESFSSSILLHWYSMGFITSVFSTACIVLLLNQIGHCPLSSHTNDNDGVSGNLGLSIARSYNSLITGSLLCFLSSLFLAILLASQYVCLMIGDVEKVWYVMQYGAFFHLPDIIFGCGIIVLSAAIVMGVFLATDILTAYILLSVIGFVIIFIGLTVVLMVSTSHRRWILHFQKSMKAIADGKVE